MSAPSSQTSTSEALPVHIIALAPVVSVRARLRGAVRSCIAVTMAGRHVVYPAATDGRDAIREGDTLLFSLPVTCDLFKSAGVVPGAGPEALTALALDAIAQAVDESVAGRSWDGVCAPLDERVLDVQALIVWFAYLGDHLALRAREPVDLDPWADRILAVRSKKRAPPADEGAEPAAKRARTDAD